jgi:AraC family transcriptional regulator
VTDYVHDYLDQDLGLAEIAGVAHLSPCHFARLFKRSTGLPPHQYVIARRVERAQALLRAGGLTAGEVAVAVGFSDQAQLTRHFKRLVGVTPARFRRG